MAAPVIAFSMSSMVIFSTALSISCSSCCSASSCDSGSVVVVVVGAVTHALTRTSKINGRIINFIFIILS